MEQPAQLSQHRTIAHHHVDAYLPGDGCSSSWSYSKIHSPAGEPSPCSHADIRRPTGHWHTTDCPHWRHWNASACKQATFRAQHCAQHLWCLILIILKRSQGN